MPVQILPALTVCLGLSYGSKRFGGPFLRRLHGPFENGTDLNNQLAKLLIYIGNFDKIYSERNKTKLNLPRSNSLPSKKVIDVKYVDTFKSFEDTYPLQSYIIQLDMQLKCFTYFSMLNPNPKNAWTGRSSVSNNLIGHLHGQNVLDIYVALHPQTNLPRFTSEDYHDINNYKAPPISYSYYTIVTRLNPNYGPINCRQYDPGNSQYYCRAICLLKANMVLTNGSCAFLPLNDTLWPSSFYEQHFLSTNCGNTTNLLNEHATSLGTMRRICEVRCPRDCHTVYHVIEFIKTNVKGQFMARHGVKPDFIFNYRPQLMFIDFVSNFGGLLGMWLGLSATMFTDLVHKVI